MWGRVSGSPNNRLMQYVNYGHLVTVSTEKEWEMSNVAKGSVRVTGAGVSG